MPTPIKMPALSPTMEEGTLAKWLVKPGDKVEAGDIMAEIETDKATMEFEAVDEGTIASIAVEEGSEGVKVGTVIAMLAEEGEDLDEAAAAAPADTASEAESETEATPAKSEKTDVVQRKLGPPTAPRNRKRPQLPLGRRTRIASSPHRLRAGSPSRRASILRR